MTSSSQPLVSILLSVYNDEHFLPLALDSILNQTYPHFELIVVNDASTDGTLPLLEDYARRDNRIKLFTRQRQGLTKNLNFAFAKATGELIARMDSDDISLPERLEKQVALYLSNPDFGLIASYFEHIDPDGKLMKRVDNIPQEQEALKARFFETNPISHGSAVIPRRVFEELGGYREAFSTVQDYDLWLRIVERYPVGIVPEVLYQHRNHQATMSAQKRFLQLQMKSLALYLKDERQRGNNPDSLAKCVNPRQQACFIKQFLKEDRQQHRKYYGKVMSDYGRRYFKAGNTSLALKTFITALQLDPIQPQTLRNMGKSLLKMVFPQAPPRWVTVRSLFF